MKLAESELLGRLGGGERIDSICRAAGWSRPEFDRWWADQTARRVPVMQGSVPARLSSEVSIERDRLGIPHIYATSDTDLFLGFGYCMAQDRLFQLDYLRRKGMGRMAEILGEPGLESDVIARTVGINRIAAAEWTTLSPQVRTLIEAFTAGVNAHIENCGDNLPIEFDLLQYRPEPWNPVDCLAIENEFRWYLTGRFPVIVMPELAKAVLGHGPLYREFLRGEADQVSILHPGEYRTADETAGSSRPVDAVGEAIGGPDACPGSNNWVVAGQRTATGRPLLASDPHIAFEAVSCWYEAHLCGGSFNVAGTAYVGIPAIMIGRNARVAWGITNNICSLRDLYRERTSAAHPDSFEFDGQWEPAARLTEVIHVRNSDPITKTIRFSRNGPIVNEILPPPANVSEQGEPVTLKWLGACHGGWLTALLDLDRAANVDEFREALRPWHVPTFSLVFADADGRIGYQTTGRIPVRATNERGYRPGWDPEHQWQGLIPFEALPHVADPRRGWIATANNRVVPNDFAYPLSGTWTSGWRAARIQSMIEAKERLNTDDFRDMQQDSFSMRAESVVGPLVSVLQSSAEAAVRTAIEHLQAWDYRVEPNSVAATLFNVFFTQWCRTVAQERFDAKSVPLLANGCEGCAARLLHDDPAGWFRGGDREAKIVATFEGCLRMLADRFGPDLSQWTWSRLHRISLKHVLSPRGDLSQLLDQTGTGVRGDGTTVCNTGDGPDWSATLGAGYRMLADLSSTPPALMGVDAQSQSGHPGSGHYSDQFEDWKRGRYHTIPLEREAATGQTAQSLKLVPID